MCSELDLTNEHGFYLNDTAVIENGRTYVIIAKPKQDSFGKWKR